MSRHYHQKFTKTETMMMMMMFIILKLIISSLWLLPLTTVYGLQMEESRKSIPKIDSLIKNFQINKNSIIKTHDSQMLGAKYLNETEFSSNEECIWWCWNTTACNLAVFEEKTRGSCYLFDCGTIEDFKCRFATHTFYTSSILQINRNSYLLNEWKSQANQENDLVGLKGKITGTGTPGKSDQVIKSGDSQPVEATETTTPHTKISKCRHYQFECRNNSECIAIYNVCDGIAQCSDGSDEAEELQCHKSRLNGKNFADTENNGSSQSAIEQEKISGSSKLSQAQTSGINSFVVPGAFVPSQFESKYTATGYNYPKSPNEKNLEENSQTNSGNVYNHNNRLQAMANGGPGDYNGYLMANWNQYQAMAAVAAGEKPSSGILLNEPSPGDIGQYQKEPPPPPIPNAYWPSFKYQTMDGLMQQQQQQQKSINRQSSQDPLSSVGIYNVPISLLNDGVSVPRNKPIADLSQYQRMAAAQQQQQQPETAHRIPDVVHVRLMNITNDKSPTPKSVITNTTDATNNNRMTAGSNKPINYARISSDSVSASASIVAMAVMHDSPGPGNGRETNSAVIALTFGLFITGILIVIVGCRMKSFKKRLARRGRSLAHDADYLINGMYL